jgi:glycosyltransferase involved in cell wall biosynthesis
MRTVYPYTIQHIDLATQDFEAVLPLLQRSACYCVYWWKQVPLAHLYLEKNELAGAAALRSRIASEMEPVIRFYSHRHHMQATGCTAAFEHNDLPAFARLMEAVFSPVTAVALPPGVDISVVICTRNRSRMLQRCLDALLRQASLPAEIIVVDNAPDNNSTEEVVKQYPAVTYVREPRPGLDIARNTGAIKASRPVVAYTDDDVILHPHWTYRVWEVFNNPEIAAMTGLVIASSLDTESQQLFEKHWSFNRGYQEKIFDHSFLQAHLSSGPPVWEIGAGANMAFRKSVLDKVGYFDERLDVGAAGCSGDSEIWFRILKHNMTILYQPLAVVHHEHRKEMQALQNQIFHYMRGFAAAALIQQEQHEQAGYRTHLYKVLPKYYKDLLVAGFPSYQERYKTIFSEIRGLISGIRYFRKHKKSPAQPVTRNHA